MFLEEMCVFLTEVKNKYQSTSEKVQQVVQIWITLPHQLFLSLVNGTPKFSEVNISYINKNIDMF